MANTLIKHVFGNVMRIAIPLTMRIRTMVDGHETETEEDFYPNLSLPIAVSLMREGGYTKTYIPTMEGNVATIEDDGTLPVGTYQVTVTCFDAQERPCRYMVRAIVQIVSATADAGIQAGVEFDSIDYVLEGAIYFYAKGDKGDAFTYADFTEEQILDLKRPAIEAAEHVAVLEGQVEEAERARVEAEDGRVIAEQGRADAEAQRVLNEESREQAETRRQQAYVQAEARRNQDYQAAESARGQQYVEAEASRNDAYNQAERERNQAFGMAEQVRDEDVARAVANAKADYVGDDNYVYHWNPTTQQYDKTNIFVKGDQGVSVQSVEQITTSHESVGVNVIRVTLTNGNTSDFEVRNGEKIEPTVIGTTLYL